MTGYNLVHMAASDGSTVDLAQLVAGSEGSLGVVTEARLRLTHFERHRALLVLRYPSFDAALASSEWLVATDPGSVETLDETVLGLARKDVIYDQVRDFLVDTGAETTRAINLVEYSGDDEASVQSKVDELLRGDRSAPGDVRCAARVRAHLEAGRAREPLEPAQEGRGPPGQRPGTPQARALRRGHGRSARRTCRRTCASSVRCSTPRDCATACSATSTWAACTCARALDLKDPEDEARIRRITDEVTELVTRHGGLLWGEHGKGFRSELVPHHFGPVLYPELQRIKAVFDPRNQLNPGKIATPAGARHLLARVDGPTRGALDRQIALADREALGTVIHCNGNGQCFDTSTDSVMCPSSKITRDRIHSPERAARR